MSFVNVKLADKKNLLNNSAYQHQNQSSLSLTNNSMPSIFNFSNSNYGMNYYTSGLNLWNGFWNPMSTMNFMPFNFTFTPSLNLFNFTPSNFSFMPTIPKFSSLFSDFNFKTPSLTNFSSTNNNKISFKDADYNKQKGEKLAKTVRRNAVGFQGDCAKYVRIALEQSGLGTGERGDGYEYAGILSRNENFKEISTSGINLSNLPAGCVLVYNRGTSGYSRQYGHVEITLGNGKAVSDGITNNIRKGARVFVPV